jgi:[acyl-carrier-protein] S-malonyltransferase
MTKIAFVFPGQGAQYIGMGKILYENYSEARQLFNTASKRLGQDIAKLCFEGPEEELKKTENTQPAILTVSLAAAKVLEAQGIEPDMLAGLSLGEYSALVFSQSICFEDAVSIVKKRAQFMQQAVPIGEGGMAVIVGLDKSQVEECCVIGSSLGVVQPSNYNSQQQIAISGHMAAIEKACEHAKLLGAKQAIKLPVSAPFHSALLTGAGEKLYKQLGKVNFKLPSIPVMSNVYARPYNSTAEIPKLLREQVSHAVRWEECVRYMTTQGVGIFIELGPGKVLSGLIKKTSGSVKTYNVEDEASLKSTIACLNRGAA